MTAGTIIGIPTGIFTLEEIRSNRRNNLTNLIASSMIGSICCTSLLRLTWISRILPIQAFGVGFMLTAVPLGILEYRAHYNGYGDYTGYDKIIPVLFGLGIGTIFATIAVIIRLVNLILITLNLS